MGAPRERTNQYVLVNNSTSAVTGKVAARDSSGNSAVWTFSAAVKRGANAAATAMVNASAVTPTVIAADTGAASWVLAVGVDPTTGRLKLTFTGVAATNIRVGAQLSAAEVTY